MRRAGRETLRCMRRRGSSASVQNAHYMCTSYNNKHRGHVPGETPRHFHSIHPHIIGRTQRVEEANRRRALSLPCRVIPEELPPKSAVSSPLPVLGCCQSPALPSSSQPQQHGGARREGLAGGERHTNKHSHAARAPPSLCQVRCERAATPPLFTCPSDSHREKAL